MPNQTEKVEKHVRTLKKGDIFETNNGQIKRYIILEPFNSSTNSMRTATISDPLSESIPNIVCNKYSPDFTDREVSFFPNATLPDNLNPKLKAVIYEEMGKTLTSAALTGNVWKLGCNWGSHKPIFYNFIKEQKIIIGENNKKYSVGDLIAVTEGHKVKAIAKINEIPISVTSNKSLEEQFGKYEIDFEDWVNYAHAEWYELDDADIFYYELQQGICRVQNPEIKQKVIELWNSRNSNYWIFQGNRNYYDFEKAIENNLLNTFNVLAHKDKIKKGDKVIIWITGGKSGCYALAEITHEPEIVGESSDNHLWNTEEEIGLKKKNDDKNSLQAGIKITHNVFEKPLLWNDIKDIEGLKDLKVGTQGTNFSATKKEYTLIRNLIRNATINNKNSTNMQANNIILYGPPGTGKTYHSIDLAVKIVQGASSDSHKENKKAFDELRKQGQIEFITFHQNYSYEDFMVGISPETTSGVLSFYKREGIFKQLTERAKHNWLSANNEEAIERDFDYVFNSFFSKLIEEEEKEIEIPMKTVGYNFKITSINIDEGRIKFTKKSGGTGHDLLIKNLKGIYDGTLNYGPDGLGVYYNPLVEKLKEYSETINPTNISKEEFKNFVLIIDEINRANISKVFGELITLLEDDKRLGRENELKITLPNGEKDFCIPPNLYIIGTMNTADKSIALIDIALRRRFEFIGKYPGYEHLTSEQSTLLQKINNAIFEKKKSADYLIGHAYFMNEQPIEIIIKNKVVPLLMEYFSGKTEIVTSLFEDTGWNVNYNTNNYTWNILKK